MLNKNDDKKLNQLQIVSISALVPEDHILRKIKKHIDFSFIYELVEDMYCLDNGRPSIDPVILIKMAMLQYLFNIKSMRQTIREIEVNVAYRWFLGLDFTDEVPHFSTFSQNYRRRFKGTDLFEKIFENILNQIMEHHLIDTDIQFIDSTHVKAHANRHKNKKVKIKPRIQAYKEQLDEDIEEDRKNHKKKELKKETKEVEEKEITVSKTDPESGLFHKGEHKEVFAYSIQTSCDRNGWIIDFKAYPGNLHDSTTFFNFYDTKIQKTNPRSIVMDAGYKIPAIAKKLLEDNVTPILPYTRPKRKTQTENPFYKKDYVYDAYYDCYICPNNEILNYTTTNRKGYKEYKSDSKSCKKCPLLERCTQSKKKQKVITRHIWESYLEECEEIRYTTEAKSLYKKRKESIERIFGSAKEHHGFRYTNMIGRAKMMMKAALTFACMNMKKFSIMKDRMDKRMMNEALI